MPPVPTKQAIPTSEVVEQSVAALPGTTATSGDAAIYDLSMWGMFMEADIIVKIVILLLLAASIWSWAIIFDKLIRFRKSDRKMRSFEQSVWAGEDLEKQYERTKHHPDHPLAKVFVAGMYEWLRLTRSQPPSGGEEGPQSSLLLEPSKADHSLKIGIRERVVHAMETVRNREMSSMEKHVGFLATVGSTAPFIGLFGTVWGIMNSFQSIAMTKNTTLAVVAPGIAEALFASVIGLFAAIPAVIFYNTISNRIASFSDRLDDFSNEFEALVAQELEG